MGLMRVVRDRPLSDGVFELELPAPPEALGAALGLFCTSPWGGGVFAPSFDPPHGPSGRDGRRGGTPCAAGRGF